MDRRGVRLTDATNEQTTRRPSKSCEQLRRALFRFFLLRHTARSLLAAAKRCGAALCCIVARAHVVRSMDLERCEHVFPVSIPQPPRYVPPQPRQRPVMSNCAMEVRLGARWLLSVYASSSLCPLAGRLRCKSPCIRAVQAGATLPRPFVDAELTVCVAILLLRAFFERGGPSSPPFRDAGPIWQHRLLVASLVALCVALKLTNDETRNEDVLTLQAVRDVIGTGFDAFAHETAFLQLLSWDTVSWLYFECAQRRLAARLQLEVRRCCGCVDANRKTASLCAVLADFWFGQQGWLVRLCDGAPCNELQTAVACAANELVGSSSRRDGARALWDRGRRADADGQAGGSAFPSAEEVWRLLFGDFGDVLP